MNKFHVVPEKELRKFNDLTVKSIVLPERKTSKSSGYDIATPVKVSINPHEKVLIPTGISVELDDDKVLMIYPRSSVGIKRNVSLANTVAVIDSDYYDNTDNSGHIFICLRNNSPEVVEFNPGDRIAQGVITKYYTTDNDKSNGVRSGGIGSTGK